MLEARVLVALSASLAVAACAGREVQDDAACEARHLAARVERCEAAYTAEHDSDPRWRETAREAAAMVLAGCAREDEASCVTLAMSEVGRWEDPLADFIEHAPARGRARLRQVCLGLPLSRPPSDDDRPRADDGPTRPMTRARALACDELRQVDFAQQVAPAAPPPKPLRPLAPLPPSEETKARQAFMDHCLPHQDAATCRCLLRALEARAAETGVSMQVFDAKTAWTLAQTPQIAVACRPWRGP